MYRIFLFFKKADILKQCAIEAIIKDLLNLNILNGLIKFHNRNITDVMISRTKICVLEIKSSKHEVMRKIKNIQHTKVLIYKNDFDNVMGFFI